MYDVTVIGPAIIDILAGPVNNNIFTLGSLPMDTIRMSFGGDALNQAVILSKLGKKVQLITKVGDDEAGKRVLNFMEKNDISLKSVSLGKEMSTGINIVLIDENGNRHFLTNPNSSLRKLALADIEKNIDNTARIISFAGMFISPLLTIPAMKNLFSKVKCQKDRLLVVDMTKAKNKETLEDIRELLPYIDYIFPNEEEIALLTGEKNPIINAKLLVKYGVKNAIIKCGEKGCIIANEFGVQKISAVENIRCIDSTGAGDSFVAGFIWALLQGLSVDECAKTGCAIASCIVEEYGATTGVQSIGKVNQRLDKISKTRIF